jgi:hypothetical protein
VLKFESKDHMGYLIDRKTFLLNKNRNYKR